MENKVEIESTVRLNRTFFADSLPTECYNRFWDGGNEMKSSKRIGIDIFFTAVILAVFFCLSMGVAKIFHTDSLIPAIFALAVFLISLHTDGYVYGIVASLLSVLALNFAFTSPYFAFNFSIPENLVSAIIMLVITIISSTLATKVKQQEKMKTESAKEKMRANLLRAISHDLRTPLTTIYGCSTAMIDEYDSLNREQILQLAGGIKEDSQWLIRMVENLLTVTRIDNNKMQLQKVPTVLEELIDTVLVKFKKRYPGQNIIIDIPEEFVSIPMDAVLIEQVLLNILENAVQHAVGMTELKLRVVLSGMYAIFEVSDDGCGIPISKMPHIFEGYFEQKDKPVDHQKRSMGIGLSVCATIIKAHQGTISVENKKNKGSCFRFVLSMGEEENE